MSSDYLPVCPMQVYDLGEDGKGMSRVAAISQQTTVQIASIVAK